MDKDSLKQLIADTTLVLEGMKGPRSVESTGAMKKRRYFQDEMDDNLVDGVVYPFVAQATTSVVNDKTTDPEIKKLIMNKGDDKKKLTRLMSDLYIYPTGKPYNYDYGDLGEWNALNPIPDHVPKKRYLKAETDLKHVRDLVQRWRQLSPKKKQSLVQMESYIPGKRGPEVGRKDIDVVNWNQQYA